MSTTIESFFDRQKRDLSNKSNEDDKKRSRKRERDRQTDRQRDRERSLNISLGIDDSDISEERI